MIASGRLFAVTIPCGLTVANSYSSARRRWHFIGASGHALRHYFGSELIRKGVPIAHVSKIMGHSSIATTERFYIHLLSSDLKDVTRVLDD